MDDLRKKIEEKLQQFQKETAEMGCMTSVVILFPNETGFNIGYVSNIPEHALRVEALQQAQFRETQDSGKPLISMN